MQEDKKNIPIKLPYKFNCLQYYMYIKFSFFCLLKSEIYIMNKADTAVVLSSSHNFIISNKYVKMCEKS